MTYKETIDRIHSLARFGSILGLERMEELMNRLGNPQDSLNIIHVAGTNGKGSVCRYLYSALQENGYKTGLYTSPYLERFTERIVFNGSEISREDIAHFGSIVFSKVDEMTEEGLDSPTEFEVVTAIGFCYFHEKEADFLVLEVGLGGRGDSTNIVKNPMAAVITSISFDHTEYLGETLEKIAIEKAGIIKNKIPVISNVKNEKAMNAIKKIAIEKSCDFYSYPLYECKNIVKNIDGYSFDVGHGIVKLSMLGEHQIENAACALKVLEILEQSDKIRLSKEKTLNGFKLAKETGRFEIISREPLIIIDGAHNESGAESLRITMKDLFYGKRVLIVAGMLENKDIDKIIKNFGQIGKDFVATQPDNIRKLDAGALGDKIRNLGYNSVEIESPKEAFRYAVSIKKNYDIILVAGSLYLIGIIRGELKNEV